jgi:hypothetical protein
MESSLKSTETEGSRHEVAQEAETPADDDERRAWAALLHTPPETRALPMPRDARAGEASTGPWRPGDVSLTEALDDVIGSPRAGGAGELRGTQDAIVMRLATTVDVSSIGRVSFCVDRSPAGLRIVVEVESEQARAAVDGERLALLRTLRTAGLNVMAFRILVNGPPGPTLAQQRRKSHVASDQENDAGSESDTESTDRHKRLRVVG